MIDKGFDMEVFEYVVRVRRHIHENPELSFEENRTAEYIEKELDAMGIPHKRINKTGIIADIDSGTEGVRVALRGDMDALPVKEDNDLPFKSKNEGVMHACGHDTHVAMVLGVAKLLLKNNLPERGSVRLIFQPSEEMFPGGAEGMIEEGAMEGVDFVLGQHANPNIPSGTVGLYYNTMMAFTDDFSVKFKSTGGHSAYPNETTDVIVLAAQYIDVVQAIISRRKDPFDPAVVSFGRIHGGDKENILPREIDLSGTVRSLDVNTRNRVRKELEDLARNLSKTFSADYEFAYQEGYPALKNAPGVTKILDDICKDLLGKENINYPLPDLGGEDFAYFTQAAPGSYYYLGVGRPDGNEGNIWHSPTFFVQEDSMKYGVEILYRGTMKLLEKSEKESE